MSKDWSWYGEEEKDSIVVKAVEPIAVYSNKDGDVVIRQRSAMDMDEDAVIIVPRVSLTVVIEAMKLAMVSSG